MGRELQTILHKTSLHVRVVYNLDILVACVEEKWKVSKTIMNGFSNQFQNDTMLV